MPVKTIYNFVRQRLDKGVPQKMLKGGGNMSVWRKMKPSDIC